MPSIVADATGTAAADIIASSSSLLCVCFYTHTPFGCTESETKKEALGSRKWHNPPSDAILEPIQHI